MSRTTRHAGREKEKSRFILFLRNEFRLLSSAGTI